MSAGAKKSASSNGSITFPNLGRLRRWLRSHAPAKATARKVAMAANTTSRPLPLIDDDAIVKSLAALLAAQAVKVLEQRRREREQKAIEPAKAVA